MFAPLTVIFAVLSVVSSIDATPARRAAPATFCDQLILSCATSGSKAISDPWSIPACIYGATCFGGSRPVDGFLAAVAAARNEPTAAKASLTVPRVTLTTFNKISTDKKVITQQNFIDGVYSTLGATDGPFPDVSFVISSFQRVNIWTAFCSAPGIPFQNFADYFQFSATVNSKGCIGGATSSRAVVSTISFTHPTPSSTPTPIPSISGEKSCQKMFETCVFSVNSAASDAWSHNSCLFAATCFGGQRPVDGLLSVLFATKTGESSSLAPTSLKETRLSDATLKKISTNGKTVTLQNWIDAYYSQLTLTGGPWPTSASVVIADFKRIQQWTAFCAAGGIPFKNMSDYFQFSSSVSSNTTC